MILLEKSKKREKCFEKALQSFWKIVKKSPKSVTVLLWKKWKMSSKSDTVLLEKLKDVFKERYGLNCALEWSILGGN